MQQKAQVISLTDKKAAVLRIQRASACGSCHNCESQDACMLREQTLTVTAENPIGAQPGDTVLVETSSRKVLLAATVVYLLPAVLFVAGYLIGETLNFFPLLTGAGTFVLAGVFAFLYNRRVARKQSLRYTVCSIEKE